MLVADITHDNNNNNVVITSLLAHIIYYRCVAAVPAHRRIL